MCEYLKLKSKTRNLKSLCETFKFEILKIEMFEFGCVNAESWKLQIKIWNFLWNVWGKLEILKIEMSKYWKLKTKMFKYWKLKIEMSEYWNVWILKTQN
jgi:hypothetical protein